MARLKPCPFKKTEAGPFQDNSKDKSQNAGISPLRPQKRGLRSRGQMVGSYWTGS
jgi:hypothetical protein